MVNLVQQLMAKYLTQPECWAKHADYWLHLDCALVQHYIHFCTYEDKVWLIANFQLHLNILNLFQCYANVPHLGVVYDRNILRCHLVYIFVLNNLLIILMDTSSQLVAYQHGICATPPSFTVIDE